LPTEYVDVGLVDDKLWSVRARPVAHWFVIMNEWCDANVSVVVHPPASALSVSDTSSHDLPMVVRTTRHVEFRRDYGKREADPELRES